MTCPSSKTLEAVPVVLSSSNQLLLCERGASKEQQKQSGFASQALNTAAEGSGQLILALPLSQNTLDSFVQGVDPASRAILTISAITQEEVGQVTSLSFRYHVFQYHFSCHQSRDNWVCSKTLMHHPGGHLHWCSGFSSYSSMAS